MAIQRLFQGDPAKNSKLYLAIGVISLVKAIAVRNDPDRFRRELLDAGLFIGVGIVLQRYSKIKAEKRAEISESVPDWLAGEAGEPGGLGATVKGRLGSEPEPEPTLQERIQDAVGGRL
ncbi:hypothetical protein ACYJ1Y_00765 [Natrialbaceae archaeon A-gly3]